MGTDTPLAVLSNQHPPLFNYFKQRFAQVTNPPIDAIREKVVTSTSVYIGAHGNLLEDKPENCKVLKVHNPILTNTDLLKIKYMNVPGFKVATVSINLLQEHQSGKGHRPRLPGSGPRLQGGCQHHHPVRPRCG